MFAYQKLFFRTLIILLFLFTGITFIVASGGGGDDGGSGGRTFSLPTGIEVQSIIGDARFDGDRCTSAGNGTKFANFIYITLVNTTSVAIEVTIPAGLIFVPVPNLGDRGPQQMMVTQDNTFIVRTGVHSFCIWVNCVGGGDTPTDEYRYRFGPFVEDECRWEIINLLRGRHLPAMGTSAADRIFDMIRHCPAEGLSDEDREFLRSLP